MIIDLHPTQMANARAAAETNNESVKDFVEGILSRIFAGDSAYLVLSPVPPADRMQAIQVFIKSVIKNEEFYGFTLLSKEEFEALIKAKADQAIGLEAQKEEEEYQENKVLQFPGKESL